MHIHLTLESSEKSFGQLIFKDIGNPNYYISLSQGSTSVMFTAQDENNYIDDFYNTIINQ